ncbi:hypothetical protein NDU88_002294 [Pleurodeles waltl]|uniref:Uncharacterized protein n=1 Tax=Pleurodeles waltl TaxID=8319 RepID=A0AAV7NGQ0_PLEWA|nr:hypothetical protein NDU88_002294 [Pleurodeles waltl]
MVLGPTKTQASQGKRTAMQAAASLTELPTSDKDKIVHMDAGETEDSSDHESVVDPLGGLPHVTPQTAEDIILSLPPPATTWNFTLWEQRPE